VSDGEVGGGEVSDGAMSAVVRPPVAYPQHNNNYCVSFSLASALCAAGDTASAAAIAALAQQTIELPAGSDRVAWLRHDCNQRLQPRWQTRKLKSVGQLNASAFLALLRAAADGTVTVFQIQDSCGNVQRCAAAVAGWLLDLNKAHDGGVPLRGAAHARHRPEDMLAGMLAAHQDIAKRADSDSVDSELVRALGVAGVVEDDE